MMSKWVKIIQAESCGLADVLLELKKIFRSRGKWLQLKNKPDLIVLHLSGSRDTLACITFRWILTKCNNTCNGITDAGLMWNIYFDCLMRMLRIRFVSLSFCQTPGSNLISKASTSEKTPRVRYQDQESRHLPRDLSHSLVIA
jgi:hypothetical protein